MNVISVGTYPSLIRQVLNEMNIQPQDKILDYNEFELAQSSLLVRLDFKVGCALTTDFISRDLNGILHAQGFNEFKTTPFYKGYVRLFTAHKANIQLKIMGIH